MVAKPGMKKLAMTRLNYSNQTSNYHAWECREFPGDEAVGKCDCLAVLHHLAGRPRLRIRLFSVRNHSLGNLIQHE